jgi:hypothetical protein
LLVETGEFATAEGVTGTVLGTDVVERDKTVIPGLVVELSDTILVLVTLVSNEDGVEVEDAAAAFADLEAANTEAEGVANGVLTLTTGEGTAKDPLVPDADAGKVVNVGFERLDKLRTFAFRLMGGWTGGAAGLVPQCAVRGNADESIPSSGVLGCLEIG